MKGKQWRIIVVNCAWSDPLPKLPAPFLMKATVMNPNGPNAQPELLSKAGGWRNGDLAEEIMSTQHNITTEKQCFRYSLSYSFSYIAVATTLNKQCTATEKQKETTSKTSQTSLYIYVQIVFDLKCMFLCKPVFFHSICYNLVVKQL